MYKVKTSLKNGHRRFKRKFFRHGAYFTQEAPFTGFATMNHIHKIARLSHGPRGSAYVVCPRLNCCSTYQYAGIKDINMDCPKKGMKRIKRMSSSSIGGMKC